MILNTSMLECATLNNNEVVGLVSRFVASEAVAFADSGATRVPPRSSP
jgi:hypothetical protein